MISFPNAKINLGLRITKKREDGFHDLESVFYPVPWREALEIIPSPAFGFNSTGISIPPASKGNLCEQAFYLLKKDFSLPEIDIHLYKNIPIGAGLGGGSADAAFTIRLINDLFKLELSEMQMENYAAQLGSDCPFFVRNQVRFCYGKGDQFEDIPLSLKGKFILLIYPQLLITTKEAYAEVVPQKPVEDLRALVQAPFSEWPDRIVNDFEKFLFPKYPILSELKAWHYQNGAFYSSMTGSGSVVYGLYEERKNQHVFKKEGFEVLGAFLD